MFSNATLASSIDCHQCVFPAASLWSNWWSNCNLFLTIYNSVWSLQICVRPNTTGQQTYYVHRGQTLGYLYLGKKVGISKWDGKRERYAHIVTHPARWLGPEPRSFDLLGQQFKNSSQDTLHRRAMLSFCFTYVRSAYILSTYSDWVCRCGYFSQICVYIHIWPFVVLPLQVIAHL